MVFEREDLEAAIEALERERVELGDVVADTAVAALRQKLMSLQTRDGRMEQATVLVADLSGFTAMSEMMDAEEVGLTLNALWQRLDRVVEVWGGTVDKHTGDGLIALFGLPTPYKDAPERAVQAAFDMQLEVAVFNEQALQRLQSDHFWVRLRLRIGIHSGPVCSRRWGIVRSIRPWGILFLLPQLWRKLPFGWGYDLG